MRPIASLEQAVPVREVLATLPLLSLRAASETGSRAGTPWEGTVEEAPRALLHGSRRS